MKFCNLFELLANENNYIGYPHLEKLIQEKGTTDEVTIAPKLSQKHIDVKHQDRQRVYLACQLLSSSASNAVKTLFPDGTAGELTNMNELADFLKLADEWFDCFNSNSKHPYHKQWKQAKHGYEEYYEYQKSVLDKFSEAVENLIIETHTDLIDWQKGVLTSTAALDLLYHEMKNQYSDVE